MTDYQRTIIFMKSLGLKESFGPYGEEGTEGYYCMDNETIVLQPAPEQNKLLGHSWASAWINFDKNGTFKSIEINGD